MTVEHFEQISVLTSVHRGFGQLGHMIESFLIGLNRCARYQGGLLFVQLTKHSTVAQRSHVLSVINKARSLSNLWDS